MEKTERTDGVVLTGFGGLAIIVPYEITPKMMIKSMEFLLKMLQDIPESLNDESMTDVLEKQNVITHLEHISDITVPGSETVM